MLKSNTLQQTLTTKLDGAKVRVQEKLFKAFVSTNDDKERAEIGAKMNVLTDVVRALSREIKEID